MFHIFLHRSQCFYRWGHSDTERLRAWLSNVLGDHWRQWKHFLHSRPKDPIQRPLKSMGVLLEVTQLVRSRVGKEPQTSSIHGTMFPLQITRLEQCSWNTWMCPCALKNLLTPVDNPRFITHFQWLVFNFQSLCLSPCPFPFLTPSAPKTGTITRLH